MADKITSTAAAISSNATAADTVNGQSRSHEDLPLSPDPGGATSTTVCTATADTDNTQQPSASVTVGGGVVEIESNDVSLNVSCQSSAERNIWSVFNPLWKLLRVDKPRLPSGSDVGADWAETVGQPEEIRHFLGLKNPVNRMTVGRLRRCIEEKLGMEGMILRGGTGTGKSALIKAFLSGFLGEFVTTPDLLARLYRTRVLNINPMELSSSPKDVSALAKAFFSLKRDRLSDIVPRFVVVDGMEMVPSKAQQVLCSLFDAGVATSAASAASGGGGGKDGGTEVGVRSSGGGGAGVRMLLATRDASKLIAALRQKVKPFKLELVEEVDGVRILLRILQLERVGYELLAIKAIFRRHWPDLKGCISVANQIFCETQYLSEVNTLKIISPRSLVVREERARHVPASAAIEPLDRCPTCTLRPPCRHTSEQELTSLGMVRRAELPQRTNRTSNSTVHDAEPDGSAEVEDCRDFLRRGGCRAFNRLGRCAYHHPLRAHEIDVPIPRCPQCTIRLPCGHCDYDLARRHLQGYCKATGARLKIHIARLQDQRSHADSAERGGTESSSVMRVSSVGSWKSTRNTGNDDDGSRRGHGQPGPLQSPSLPRQRPSAHTTSMHTTTTRATRTGSWSVAVTGSMIDTAETVSAAATTAPEDEASPPPPAAMESSTTSRNRIFDSIRQSLASKESNENYQKQTMNLPTDKYDISKILSKLEFLCDLVATSAAWAVDDGPRGGLREFRVGKFNQMMQVIFSQCERTLGEAESAGRVACSHQGTAVEQQG